MSEELAWAAGFFDGEGCTSTDKWDRIRITIGQKDRRVLGRFAAAVGAGKVYGPYRRPGEFFFYVVNRAESPEVIRKLWPFLSDLKREQARKALDVDGTMRKTKEEKCR
jgi:hypothetical protein